MDILPPIDFLKTHHEHRFLAENFFNMLLINVNLLLCRAQRHSQNCSTWSRDQTSLTQTTNFVPERTVVQGAPMASLHSPSLGSKPNRFI